LERHFLPEPYIVIEMVLHELLHVFVGAAVDFGGNAVELRYTDSNEHRPEEDSNL
jgi:hypothetical protein